ILLLAPYLQRKLAVGRRQAAEHGADATPAVPLVEARGTFVADRAGEPGALHAMGAHAPFRVGDERRRDSGSARLRSDVELVQLVVVRHAEAERLPRRAGDAHARECGLQSFAETRERA